jgi:hypothetical protein
MLEQDRIKKNLRTVARPFGRITQLRPQRIARRFLSVKLIPRQPGYINEITRVIFRPARFLYSVGDASPATELHRAGGKLAHFWNRNTPVALLYK